jgi:hypothetical protein
MVQGGGFAVKGDESRVEGRRCGYQGSGYMVNENLKPLLVFSHARVIDETYT